MSDDNNSNPPAEDVDAAKEGEAAETSPQETAHAAGDVICEVYRIEAVVSAEPGDEVYEALHQDKQTRHLVRPVGPALAGNSKAMETLLREAGLLRYLEQEAVADYEGVLRDDSGRDYLIMEHVEGQTLAERLAEGPLEGAEVITLRDRVGRGLMAAHELRLVHRQLGPDKIVLEDGDITKAKIVDFGLLRAGDDAVKSMATDDPAGDFVYAAPEQLGLYGATINQRTDIFCFGLVLAAAALGRPIDEGKTGVQLLKDRQSPADLSALDESLRGEIAPLLKPDPKDRPSNLGDLIVAEEAASMAAQLSANSELRSSSKQPSGGLQGWSLVGAGVMVVIAAVLFYLQVFDEPQDDLQRAQAIARAQQEQQAEASGEELAPEEAEAGEVEAVSEPEPPAEPASETQVAASETPEPAPEPTTAEPEEDTAGAASEEPESASPAQAEETATDSSEPPAEESVAEAQAESAEAESAMAMAPSEPEASTTEAEATDNESDADVEGLLPPPGLPEDLQESAEEAAAEMAEDSTEEPAQESADATAASEPETAADAEASEPETAMASETTGDQAAANEESEGEAMAAEETAEESPEQVAALPPAESEPAPPSAAEAFDSVLADGQRRQVQRALASLGLYQGAIDGIIGKGTRGAIEAYQRQVGATEDGFVDESLFARLAEIAPAVVAAQESDSLDALTRTPTQQAAVTPRRPSSLADKLRQQEIARASESLLGNDFEWLMRRALSGDRASQTLLASRYQRGQGAPLNLVQAVKWYRLAAEQGDPKGQYNLGLLYESGSGVTQDYQQAAAWFARAAEQNLPGARERLDALYARGLVEPPS